MSTYSNASTVVDLPIPKISQSLNIQKEDLSKSKREHSKSKVPVIMILGKKENENKTASIRRLGSEKNELFEIDEIITKLYKESFSPNN